MKDKNKAKNLLLSEILNRFLINISIFRQIQKKLLMIFNLNIIKENLYLIRIRLMSFVLKLDQEDLNLQK